MPTAAWRKCWRGPIIDGVVLAVPNYVHEEACCEGGACRAARAVRKADDDDRQTGRNMAAVCKQAGVQLLMGFVTRFEPQTEQ
jgi:predicted dehydrogenase